MFRGGGVKEFNENIKLVAYVVIRPFEKKCRKVVYVLINDP
jgi:hypothetical protein